MEYTARQSRNQRKTEPQISRISPDCFFMSSMRATFNPYVEVSSVCICVPQSGMVSLFLFGLENLAEKTRFYRLVT
mgnify:CR=1 FL=1